jgi:hypothetical protein
MKRISLGMAACAALAIPVTAAAATYGFNLNLTVAVNCSVYHQPTGFGAVNGDAVALGSFREYCNAPQGYDLVVNYTPGSLQGTRIIAGNDEIILNGSGQAILSRATGPRMRVRPIAAVPGARGFDTDRLELSIIPS